VCVNVCICVAVCAREQGVPGWKTPIPVRGCSEQGQFTPFMEEGKNTLTWDVNMYRTLELEWGPDIYYFGIRTVR